MFIPAAAPTTTSSRPTFLDIRPRSVPGAASGWVASMCWWIASTRRSITWRTQLLWKRLRQKRCASRPCGAKTMCSRSLRLNLNRMPRQQISSICRNAHPVRYWKSRLMACIAYALLLVPLGRAQTFRENAHLIDSVHELPVGMGALPVPPVPSDNPQTLKKIALGRRLFFDKQLSGDGSISCGSCHDPKKGLSDGRPKAVGFMVPRCPGAPPAFGTRLTTPLNSGTDALLRSKNRRLAPCPRRTK